MDANPHDPRFGRCPSSTASASRREPDHTSFLAAAAAAPPPRGHHRRAHSETFLRLPDDFLLDSDPDFGIADIEFPSLSDENGSSGGMFAPVEAQPKVEAEKGKGKPVGGAHLRSLSVDAALFEGLGFQGEQGCGEVGGNGVAVDRKVSHRHSSSMDGSTSPFEAESATSKDFTKKAMAADKLADLALLDPKRAKRILANRQSAARSKERKIRYMNELERKVQTLQTEATTLSAQLTLLQRDTTDLTTENKELKLRLQAMEQQAHLRDALNEALRDEVQRLKIATGQIPAVNGNNFNRGLQQSMPQYFPQPQQMNNVGASQAQRQTQQFHASLKPSSNNQPLSGQSPVNSMDFM